jgi:hypothetical protein
MELHNAYHEIRSLQFKVSEYDALIKNAQEPELKIAYSTIQSLSVVKLNELQTKMVHTISTLVGNPEPK